MTQLVQRLESQGLLERCSDPDDGRACLVKVSEGGRRLWEERAVVRKQRIAELLAALPEDDQRRTVARRSGRGPAGRSDARDSRRSGHHRRIG